MDSQMDSSILYQRPKQSEMMQGISDAVRAIDLEFQRLQRFYYFYESSTGIWSAINQLQGQLSYWDIQIQELRKKGL